MGIVRTGGNGRFCASADEYKRSNFAVRLAGIIADEPCISCNNLLCSHSPGARRTRVPLPSRAKPVHSPAVEPIAQMLPGACFRCAAAEALAGRRPHPPTPLFRQHKRRGGSLRRDIPPVSPDGQRPRDKKRDQTVSRGERRKMPRSLVTWVSGTAGRGQRGSLRPRVVRAGQPSCVCRLPNTDSHFSSTRNVSWGGAAPLRSCLR